MALNESQSNSQTQGQTSSTQANRPVRVRFAPSPTGRLHVGSARTAIYNWAFAKATGGSFVLRIEDTDPERSTEENVGIILRAMRWLGLDWDEGPEVGGDFGPYFQTARTAHYQKALETLKEKGAVYPCFCTKEELDAKRQRAEQEEGGYAGYDRTCRELDPKEAQARIDAGESHVWRLKVPEDHGPIEFVDAVYGPMSFPADVMDDMIVVRSDGTPTYNFAVVCDDVAMEMTHIIRGDDHLSNTPRQILIYEALEAPIPVFAHLPMILGPDGKKLSKRHGATSVEQYRDCGYLADALVNYLALLGWSLDGETTIISREELCSSFSLERINRKDAVFDEVKLDWMNGSYIRALDPESWFEEAKPWLALAKLKGESLEPDVSFTSAQQANNSPRDTSEDADEDETFERAVHEAGLSEDHIEKLLQELNQSKDFFLKVYPLIIERLNRFNELPDKLAYLFWGPKVLLDQESVEKVLRKEGSRADVALSACRDILADRAYPWECDALQQACRDLCEPLELKAKMLFQPLRVAICGNKVSPPLFESIELMDRDDVVARIDQVQQRVFEPVSGL